jgi:sporulation protein YlmC with PRC-barrel domain
MNVGASRPRILAADALQGDPVVDRSGRNLGCIEDVVIDVQRATVAYAVVSTPAVPALGERLFVIPWSALTLDAAHGRFVLDTDAARLETAPGFNKDHWPSMADASWANQVHEYFGVHPYWNETLET